MSCNITLNSFQLIMIIFINKKIKLKRIKHMKISAGKKMFFFSSPGVAEQIRLYLLIIDSLIKYVINYGLIELYSSSIANLQTIISQ